MRDYYSVSGLNEYKYRFEGHGTEWHFYQTTEGYHEAATSIVASCNNSWVDFDSRVIEIMDIKHDIPRRFEVTIEAIPEYTATEILKPTNNKEVSDEVSS